MHITFGMNMDGAAWSDKPASFGEVCCGPIGLLSLLEGKLGLDGVKATLPASKRIFDYQQKIEKTAPAWCAASFRLDSWNTAIQLLAWRDELLLAGWDGKSGSSERLKALAAIEANLSPLAEGQPERLEKVLEALQDVKITGTLELMTSKGHLPLLWQNAVDALETAGMTVVDSSTASPCTAKLLCVTAPDELALARDFARFLVAGDNSQVAVIAEGDTRLLDGFLHQYGLGAIGHTTPSQYRESLQILPLWLDLLWKPFNPKHFIELLTLPVSPIRPTVCRMLANVLRKTPGIGSEEWDKGWDDLLDKIRANASGKYPDPVAEENKVSELRNFLEKQCFQAEKATGMTILSMCEQLTAKLGPWVNDHPALGITISMAEDLKKIIDPIKEYDRITLVRMLDTVMGKGTTGNAVKEVTPFTVYAHPGAVKTQHRTLLWWNFVTDSQKRDTYWTPDEIATVPALASRVAERETQAWHRALGFTTDTVIAFTPQKLIGEEAFPHPLADEIPFENLPSESLVDDKGNWALAGRNLALAPLSLDSPQTDYTLPANTIAPRRPLSYTQMSKFLSCPFKWFLDDYVGLDKPSVLDIPTGPMMVGSLAHKVVELIYKGTTAPLDPNDAKIRAGQLFDELVPQMAAELLLDGRNVEKTRIKNILQRSIYNLVEGINKQGLTVKETEKHLDGKFQGMDFTGSSDIYLEDKAGNAFIIDMKWSNSNKYKDEIESHKALQLATYAWLLRPADYKAKCAYYLFPKCNFYQAENENWQDMWNQATNLWNQRMKTLRDGQLELGNPDDKDQLAEPKCSYCEYRTICGREVK